jgi:hypothetical protein
MADRKRSGAPGAYPAEGARQDEIVLRTRMHRAIFVAGLLAAVLLGLALLLGPS